MMRLEVSTLGPLRVSWAGQPVEMSSTTSGALLAYLAVEAGRPHRRETLAFLLWPDHHQAAAYANLRQALSRLRRGLPDEIEVTSFLQVDAQTIGFDLRGATVDVSTFEDLVSRCTSHEHPDAAACETCVILLAEAADLYHGELLEGIRLPAGSQPLEEWLTARREALRRAAKWTLHTLVDHSRLSGRPDRMESYARVLLGIDHLSEESHRMLMLALAMRGDRSGALAQYDSCRRTLADELGVEPEDQTVLLAEQIRTSRLSSGRTVDDPAAPNLPADLTEFVGRQDDLSELVDLLRSGARLITLTGIGGMGKTRLAMELARRRLAEHEDGVHFVALASLGSASAVAPTIATALGLTIHGGDPHYGGDPQSALMHAIRDRRMMLVLDNFEHLLGGTDLVVEMLRTAPGLVVVITSREPLNTGGEHTYVVRGLDYRSGVGRDTLDTARPGAAARLFAQSVSRLRTGFEIGPDNIDQVLRICELVDGMPLGLELAAAWSDTLTLDEIAFEIEHGLDFLARERNDLPPRQRSIRAVLESSWRRLDHLEREAFRTLSVFRGGFTRTAALDVAGASLGLLGGLVRKAMLNLVDTGTRAGRYEMHELLRHFAFEELSKSREGFDVACARHAAFCLTLAQTATQKFLSSEQSEWLDRVEREHDNMRAALQWAAEAGRIDLGLRLGGALWPFWQRRCHLAEGQRWLEGFLQQGFEGVEDEVVAEAYLGAAWLAHDRDDFGEADRLFNESLRIDRELGSTSRVSAVLAHRGVMARGQGRYGEAIELIEESLALSRSRGNELDVAYALFRLGLVTREQGDYERAASAYRECLTTYERAGDRSSASFAILGLGDIARDRGDHAQLVIHCETSLNIARELGRHWGAGFALNNLAIAALMQDDLVQAERYIGEAHRIFHAHGIRGGVLEVLVTEAQIAIAGGDHDSARSRISEALTQGWPQGPLWLVVSALEELARVVCAADRPDVAVSLCGAATAWRLANEAPIQPYREATISALLDDARQAVGSMRFEQLWSEGAKWTLERAVEHALSETGYGAHLLSG